MGGCLLLQHGPGKKLLLGMHVQQQVSYAVAVAKLVVIPGNEFDEVVVEGDASASIKDGGVGVSNEVRGNHRVLSVSENPLHWSMGGLLDGIFDGGVAGRPDQTAGQVHHGDVGHRNTEGHAGQLPVELGDDLAHCLGSAGGGWNDVLVCTTAIAPSLGRRPIYCLLGGRVGMD